MPRVIAMSDAFPCVFRRMLGAVPAQARLAFAGVPVAFQISFGILEWPAFVSRARLPAILVSRTIVVVARAGFDVWARRVVALPILIFCGGIDGFRGAFARESARHCANDCAD